MPAPIISMMARISTQLRIVMVALLLSIAGIGSGQAQDDDFDVLLRTVADYQARGELQKAFDILAKAVAYLERKPALNRHALVLGYLSDGYLLARRLDEATDYAEQSVAVARQGSMPLILAEALNHLGNAYLAEQRYTEAQQAYHEGFQFTEKASDVALGSALLINKLHGYLASGNGTHAISTLKIGLSKTRSLPASSNKAFALISLGYLAKRLAIITPNYQQFLSKTAYQALAEARDLAEKFDDPRAKSYAIGHLGELYVMAKRNDEAEQLLRQALFFADHIELPELQARWHWQIGRSLKATGQIKRAKTAYGKALDHLASIRTALVFGQRGNPYFFQETVGTIYRELAELLLDESNAAVGEAQRHKALREMKGVMERFKVAELQNYFQDGCVTALQDKLKIKTLESVMEPTTATFYPIVFPERLLLLLSFSDGEMYSVEVQVTASELRHAVMAFRKVLSHHSNPRRLRKFGFALSEWLIKPIEQELSARKIDTIVVVTEAALRLLPFAALYDGKDFLVNRYAFAVTPGLTLTDPGGSTTKSRRVLFGGLSESVQGFGELPHVQNEMAKIASLYGGAQLVNQGFVKDRIQAELTRTPYSTIAFATHAQIDKDPRKSFLLTYNERMNLDELASLVRISQFRHQPIELMVLSACETAEGDERAALGLAGMAIKAGAQSVMASLWAVNDASTAELVTLFFENLKSPEFSKAQALQQAQKKMLAGLVYKHPFYWAPFILIGNWL